jgi:phosphoglycolate phosphatase
MMLMSSKTPAKSDHYGGAELEIRNKKLILFDLDGTLTDPKEGITRSFQYALKKMGISEDRDNLLKVIGPPLWDSFEQFYAMSREESDRAVQYYREYFSEKGLYENEVIETIPQLLHDLKENGKILAVATSKPTIYSVKILKYFQLDRYFHLIVGSELDGTRVRKDEIISHVLNVLGYCAQEAVMIGDRKHDIIGARAHGMTSIGVLFGYGSEEELRASGSDFLASSTSQLRQYLLG